MADWIRKQDAREQVNINQKNRVCYLTFPALEQTGMVSHAFSTRIGGRESSRQ